MKKLLLLISLFFAFNLGYAQFPISQSLGSSKTLVTSKGGLSADSALILPVFVDTFAANVYPYAKSYAGNLIRINNTVFIRDASATRWIPITDAGLYNGTRLVSGTAIWDSLLIFRVTNCTYYILGNFYSSLATTITLPPADPTYPRIDVIYLDTAGNVGVIQGVPATSPAKPIVDPQSQIELTHINVNAGSTTPGGITSQLVYNENVQLPNEWNTSTDGTGVNFNYATNPYNGVKSTFIPEVDAKKNIDYSHVTTIDADNCAYLSMFVRLNSQVPGGVKSEVGGGGQAPTLLAIYLYEAGNLVSKLLLDGGIYNFDPTIIGSYQNVVIPFDDFVFNTSTREFDKIRIVPVAGIKLGFQLDYITIQFGGDVPPIINNSWVLTGNDVGTYVNPQLGTTSKSPLKIVTDNTERMVVSEDGIVSVNSLAASTTSDTTNYKPVAANSSGELVKMNNWAGGGSGTTPNLQQVTDVGNTTTNPIIMDSGDLNMDGGNIVLRSDLGSNIAWTDNINATTLQAYLPTSNAIITLPNITGTLALSVNGNFADSAGNITLPSITTPNLQQVTDVGDTTTNDIYVNRLGLFDGAWLGYGNFQINDENLEFHPSALSPYNTWGFSSYFLTMPRFFSLPDTSGTVALSVNGNFADSKGNITLTSVAGVDSIYRTQGIDSIYYKKNGNTYAIKDSVGNVGGGGGGGKIYYFNGGVSMGTFGGIAMYELGDTAITGTAANFTKATTGNIANFITDVNKPGLLQIPAGVWTIDTYLSEAGGGSNHAEIYAILEKWDGSTITTIATSPIEEITNGSTPDLYTYTISVPTTTLASTDRIIIQFYIQNTNGKTVTLYTQNGYVGEVHTTFTTGIGALNGLTAPSQSFATGTSGTDFNISSATSTHTFNLPTASATNRGALSSTDWSTFNGKIGAADTSVFQRKSISAYSFMANNTNAAANTTAQTFRTSGLQTYSGTITWTGSTAPSGTTNHTYNWTQIGNLVTMNITLIYGTASVLTTQVTMALPSGAPTPIEQTGLGAANEILCYGSGQITTAASSSNSNFNRSMLRINPTDTGYELFLNCTAQAAYRYANITIQYFTNQ